MMRARPIVQPARVYARLIHRDATSPYSLLGHPLAADGDGPNGPAGWQTASYDDRLGEHGDFEVAMPNGPGSDGRMHRDRYAILTDTPYHPGDEWVELWREGDEHPLYVGTPVERLIGPGEITVKGVDARAPVVLGKQRETASAFLLGSPQDVTAGLCGAWTAPVHHDHTITPLPIAAGGSLVGVGQVTIGRVSRPWRVETAVRRSALAAGVTLTVDQASGGAADRLELSITGESTATCRSGASTDSPALVKAGRDVHLAIEGRGRWAYFYLDAKLLVVLPVVVTGPLQRTVTAKVAVATADLTMLLARQRATFITPLILDRRTPGLPPSTGLLGAYHNEVAPPNGPSRHLAPTKEPYARRIDATINFAAANPPAWQPPGALGDQLGVRWTGSIRLDVDTRLRVTNLDNTATIRLGDTTEGREYLTATTTTATGPWLTAHLPGQALGWLPIIVAYENQGASGGITLQAERADTPGVWRTCGAPGDQLAPRLSHLGVYQHYARHDSQAEQIKEIAQQTGLQSRLAPRSLESGQFPGVLEIAPRVGRDTDLTITDLDDTTDVANQANAGDVATALLAEGAAGTDGEQATLEVIAHYLIGEHVLIHSDTESLAGIIDRALLAQRADTLSLLRATMDQELSARPRGLRELADTFPLTGQLAEHRWEAGDGVRFDRPDINAVDSQPRQLLAATWALVPDGIKAPTVSFRQRPAGLLTLIRRLARRIALAQRTPTP